MTFVLDATTRSKSYLTASNLPIHFSCTLGEFIQKGINDPAHSGNCLDSMALRAETPPFMV